MKAILYREYGPPDVLRCEEIEKPAPAQGEVLVKVRAASVNPLDWHFLRGTPYLIRIMSGLGRPKVTRLGVDLAGEVEAIGSDATQFKPGDPVFGSCRGAFAEYVCARETELVGKPDNVSFEEAACAPVAGITALQALRDKGRVQAGQTVLINGAAGGVGTFAVQIAKSLGALVTGVCSSRNVEMVRSIGADRVVDYTKEDFTRGGEHYDVMLDCAGNRSLGDCRRALTANGTYIFVGAQGEGWLRPLDRILKVIAVSPFVRPKLTTMMTSGTREDLAAVGQLLASGKVRAVIDRRYALAQVPDAIRYVEQGHARGKVIVVVASSE